MTLAFSPFGFKDGCMKYGFHAYEKRKIDI